MKTFILTFVVLLLCKTKGDVVEDCMEDVFANYISHFDFFFTSIRHQPLVAETVWSIIDDLGCYRNNPGPDCTERNINISVAFGCQYIQKSLWPTSFDPLEKKLYAYIQNEPSSTKRRDGKRIGERNAKQVLRSRANDGAFGFVEYYPTVGDGRWVPTPAFPTETVSMLVHWADVDPWVLRRPDQFYVPPPPATSSQTFFDSANHTFYYGSQTSTVRSASQTEGAFFHDAGPGSETAVGTWTRMAITVGKQLGYTTPQIATMCRLMSFAIHDILVSNVFWKNVYDTIRPVSVYTRTGIVSNPNLPQDANWKPLIYYPSNQEYPAGHATGAGAAGQMMKLLTGRNDITFTLSSSFIFQGQFHPLLQVNVPVIQPRTYNTFDEFMEEGSEARVWGGMHFRHSNAVGKQNGIDVANFVFDSLCRNRRCMD